MEKCAVYWGVLWAVEGMQNPIPSGHYLYNSLFFSLGIDFETNDRYGNMTYNAFAHHVPPSSHFGRLL